MARGYWFQFEDYLEAMARMRLAATRLTEHDCVQLTEIWRSALAASESLDPLDLIDVEISYVGLRGIPEDPHGYYWNLSQMVKYTLWEKRYLEEKMERAEG